jgi:hypothetical protein
MKRLSRLSWLSPKLEVRYTDRYGCGSFAIAPIAKGELVSVQGGHIITLDELFSLAPPPFDERATRG